MAQAASSLKGLSCLLGSGGPTKEGHEVGQLAFKKGPGICRLRFSLYFFIWDFYIHVCILYKLTIFLYHINFDFGMEVLNLFGVIYSLKFRIVHMKNSLFGSFIVGRFLKNL